MIEIHEPRTINVITQNILHDVTRTKNKLILPQNDRLASLAATLNNFPGELDVVGIQEAYKEKTTGEHNGEILAEMCGYGPGFWEEHNQKPYPKSPTGRTGEHVGLFGAAVNHAELIELGDRRRAVLTEIAGVALVTLHLRCGFSREKRAARNLQAIELIEAVEEYDDVVLLGDLNEPEIRGIGRMHGNARNVIRKAGFTSVFSLTGQRAPATCPIEPYVPAMSRNSQLENRFVKRAWPIDDILIRGDRVRTIGAGVLERVVLAGRDTGNDSLPATVPREGSDHDGLWATLKIS